MTDVLKLQNAAEESNDDAPSSTFSIWGCTNAETKALQ